MSRQVDTLFSGTSTVGTSSAMITTGPQGGIEMFVQNDPDNTVDVFIGNSAMQTVQLQPGHSFTLHINNPAQIYAKTPSGTALVNWMVIGQGQ